MSKENDRKDTINIEIQEGDEIDGEVVRELVRSKYDDKPYSSDKENTLTNNLEEKQEQDFVSRKIIRKKGKRRTPSVDGEEFDIKRTYMMRKSTVRMLNQLKGMSEEVIFI